MAEDICRKSAIIETYVMDSRRGNTQTHTDVTSKCEMNPGKNLHTFTPTSFYTSKQ